MKIVSCCTFNLSIVLFCCLLHRQANAAENLIRQDDAKKRIAAALNNRGNDYLKQAGENLARIDTAISFYRKAIEYDPDDPGIKLNLGISHLAKRDTTSADSLFLAAYIQSGRDEEKLYSLLGLDASKFKNPKAALQNITEEEIDAMIKYAVATDRAQKDKVRVSPPVRPKKPPKSVDPREIKEFLYIKQIAQP